MLCLYGADEKRLRAASLALEVPISTIIRFAITAFLRKVIKMWSQSSKIRLNSVKSTISGQISNSTGFMAIFLNFLPT